MYRGNCRLIYWVIAILVVAACGVAPDRTEMFPTVTGPAPEITEVPNQAATTGLVPTATLKSSLGAELPSAINLPEVDVENPRTQKLRDYLNKLTESGQFMGTVLIADGEKILVNDGFGFADMTTGRANTPQTQLRIGSLTKQFTAAAILRLQELGRLDVNEPVIKYLPDYSQGEQITIHHLLTHTAGIPNYTERPDLSQVVQTPIPLAVLLDDISSQPLDFVPGQQFSYSDSGYIVLTKIIEQVSGQSYAEFLQARFFDPLGMARSGYDFLDPGLEEPAVGYHLRSGDSQQAVDTDSSWPSGAGALYSTAEDMYVWDRALNSNLILNEASRKAMFNPWTATGQDFAYGYGWEIGNMAGRSSQTHAGTIFGFGSFIARFPQDDATIIVLSNGLQMSPRRIAGELAQILFSG